MSEPRGYQRFFAELKRRHVFRVMAMYGAVGFIILQSVDLLIPNLNSIAMEPMARVAGTASSIMGAAQLGLGALLGSLIDRAFDGTVLPLALGFLLYGVLAFALVLWAEGGRLRLGPAVASPGPSSD